MRKHWILYLKDVGRPMLYNAENQIIILEKIKELESRINILKEKYEKEENELISIIKKEWSQSEIEEAKILYTNFINQNK